MADFIEKYADKASEELEKRIKRVYKQAAKEVQEKLNDFMERHKARNAKMLQMLADDKISENDYKRWMQGQVFQGNQWRQKLKDVTEVYVHADEKAREIVGKTTKNVFMEAANYAAYDIEKNTSGAIAFNVYDAKTVERLLKDDPKMLPEWKIDQPKDYTWNEKRVRNAVTQGIIQGESIEEVGERLTGELATSNAAKMNMFARTAVNGAQNAGRMDRLYEAEKNGIDVRRKWLATLDGRTRDTHRALDGQVQKPKDPFVIDGMSIMFPGDPTAPARLVYNCRCTLTYVYPKYQYLQHNHERRDQMNDKNIENMTYYEWIGLEKKRIANNDISFVETEKVKKVECPYEDEMSDKGYVGLSASESDEFIKTYHNKRIIGKKGSNTMDGTQSRRINTAFRNDEIPTNPADVKLVQKLDAEINKNELPQDMTLFRGVSLDAFSDSGVFDGFEKTIVEMSDFKDASGNIDFDKWGKAYEEATNKDLEDKLSRAKKLIGTTIEDKGYMQVSASSQRNVFAASEIGLQIHAPEGTKAYISDYQGESEIILGRGTSYRVLDATIATTTLENGNQIKNIQLIVETVDETENEQKSNNAPAKSVEQKSKYTKSEEEAIHEYTTSSYSGVNSALREGTVDNYKDVKDIVDKIDSAMEKTVVNDGTVTSRGASMADLRGMFEGKRRSWFEDPDNLKSLEGQTASFKSYLSTTKGDTVAEPYKREVQWHFTTEGQVHGIDAEQFASSSVKSEREIVFDRDAKIEIEKVKVNVDSDGDIDGVVEIWAKIKGSKQEEQTETQDTSYQYHATTAKAIKRRKTNASGI